MLFFPRSPVRTYSLFALALVFLCVLQPGEVCLQAQVPTATPSSPTSPDEKRPVLNGIELPEQVPYLNPKRPLQTLFCVGNGIGGAIADAQGSWNSMFGPGYGADEAGICSRLQVSIDGAAHLIQTDFKRAQKAGVFYSVQTEGDVRFYEIDYACQGESWLGRLIWVDNLSPSTAHEISVQAFFCNASAPLRDAQGKLCGYRQKQFCAAFTDPLSSASTDGGALQTETKKLPPGGSCSFGLVYELKPGDDVAQLNAIRAIDPVASAANCLSEWQKWYDDVPPAYRLDRITDPRARNLIEGGLAVLRINQSADGGFMATPTMYRNGYVRDGFHASRALIQTGHFAEALKWLDWVNSKFQYTGHVADAWALSSVREQTKGADVGLADVEQPALVLLCARDYYHATHNLAVLGTLDPLLKYCVEVQLQYAEKNGYALPFNGDETEICFAVPSGPAGYGSRGGGDLAWSSTALAAGSIDFYIKNFQAKGLDPANFTNSLTGKTINLPEEEKKFQDAMERFWRTDMPGNPRGFHDAFIRANDGSRPTHPTSNFTLQPVSFGVPYQNPDRRVKDVDAIKQDFNRQTGNLQLFPGVDNGFCGHDTGYLLSALLAVKDPMAKDVYEALLNGPSVSWLGYWNEAYAADGTPCTDYAKGAENGLRSMETGCNIAAIAQYWKLGEPHP
jgi:hypothetical protein